MRRIENCTVKLEWAGFGNVPSGLEGFVDKIWNEGEEVSWSKAGMNTVCTTLAFR